MIMDKVSARRNPLFQGYTPLEFDNVLLGELTDLTDAQEGERFLSHWLEVMRPFTRYSRYFKESEKTKEHILKEVKTYFIRYVVRGDWEERKYALVLDNILANKFALAPKTFEVGSKLYEEERLPLQLQEKRAANRRNRI